MTASRKQTPDNLEFGIERLEHRLLLAGSVIVDGTTLVIDGDNTANLIEVTDDGGAALVTIDGENFGPFAGITLFDINAMKGSDTVRIDFLGTPSTIEGGAGKDTIDGSDVADTINGGGGRDTINGRGGEDTINGGAGGDTIVGFSGSDIINGGGGSDTITGGGAADMIDGGAGRDTIGGGGGADMIDGGGGDTINGGAGKDLVNGDAGNDTIFGDAGNDVLLGNAGDDTIDGGPGRDNITGGSGVDLLVGGPDPTFDVFNIEWDSGLGALPDSGLITGSGRDRINVTGTTSPADVAFATFQLTDNSLLPFSDYVPGVDKLFFL